MNRAPATAEETIFDSNGSAALTPDGRLIAKLVPKRRFKMRTASEPIAIDEATGRSNYPLKRSGQPHPLWKRNAEALKGEAPSVFERSANAIFFMTQMTQKKAVTQFYRKSLKLFWTVRPVFDLKTSLNGAPEELIG